MFDNNLHLKTRTSIKGWKYQILQRKKAGDYKITSLCHFRL